MTIMASDSSSMEKCSKRVLENNGGGFAQLVNSLPETQQDPLIRVKRSGIIKAFFADGDELIWTDTRCLRNGYMLSPFIGVALMRGHLQDKKLLVVIGESQLLENSIGEIDDFIEVPAL